MSDKFRIYLDKWHNFKVVDLSLKQELNEERFLGRQIYSSYDAALLDLIEIKKKLGRKLTILEKSKLAAIDVDEEKRAEIKDEETKNNIFRIYKNLKDELVIVSCNPVHCTHIRNKFYSKEKYETREKAIEALIKIKQELHMKLNTEEQNFLMKG